MNMHSPTPHFCQAICLLSLMISWPTAYAGLPPEGNHQPVTGSRLLPADPLSAAPLTVYTRDDILHSGENNLADFIRSLSVNTFGSFRPQSGTTSQNISTVSLKGLGSGRNLVLIDGRRLPKSPTNASAQDLNLIPLVAVDRIEVLAEGAGAIYGSHAMSGVINVITRDEFVGTELMLGGAEVSIPRNGGQRESGSVVFGTRHERGGLTAAVGWNDREIVLQRDLPWTETEFSIYGNSFTTIIDGVDQYNWTTLPGACDFSQRGFIEVPHSNAISATRCAYDYNQQNADEASIENKSFWAYAHRQITDQWLLEARSGFWQTTSLGQYAPVPDSSFFSTPLSANSPNNPTNPGSPMFDPSLGLSQQAVNWWHRFDALGNRITTIETQLQDMNLELTGQLPLGQLQLGLRYTDTRSADVARNLVLRSAAGALIESGEYSLLNPYAAPEEVLNRMRFTAYRDARYDQNEAYAQWTFKPFSIAGISAEAVIGAEFTAEKHADLFDPQSLSEGIAGTAGTQSLANRDTRSVYAENLFRVSDELHIRLAARHDDYSDLGADLSGHLSVQFRPVGRLGLYAAHSVNHQTPDLSMMNVISLGSATSVRDDAACLFVPQYCQVDILEFQQPNNTLQSEQLKSLNLGVNFKATDWLTFQLHYWDLEITDNIRYLNAQFVLNRENQGLPLPASLGCTRTITGLVTRCTSGYINEGSVQASGLDLSTHLDYQWASVSGQSELSISHVMDSRQSRISRGANEVGSAGKPDNRATLKHQLNWQNWQLVLQTHFIDGQQPYGGQPTRVPSWVTHDVQLNYATSWQGLITLGAQNIAEKYPPVGLGALGNRSYDFELYDGFGRIVYARYTQTF